jgi:general secretion pathway protein G
MLAIQRKKGFTLVEILIVVIILGILAAIVIPQFTNASEDARKSSLTSQLQTIRSQVELYKLQHRDQYPTSTGLVGGTWDWAKLTGQTDENGQVYEAGESESGPFGPYLQAAPKNPLNGQDAIILGDDITDPDDLSFANGQNRGWMITPTGKVYALSKTGAYIYNEAKVSDPKNGQ